MTLGWLLLLVMCFIFLDRNGQRLDFYYFKRICRTIDSITTGRSQRARGIELKQMDGEESDVLLHAHTYTPAPNRKKKTTTTTTKRCAPWRVEKRQFKEAVKRKSFHIN